MNAGAEYRIPLLIGVTGHRDLLVEDRDAIAASVTTFFRMLAKRFPHTPLRVFCGLAAGADQLVAEIALAFGAELVPVLAVPPAVFRTTLETDPQARETYDRLLDGRPPIVLDALATEPHDDAYALLADFLTVRCQLLLGLWDGSERAAIGGTAFTIASKLNRRLDSDAALTDPIESGLVYHIPIRRRRAPDRRPENDEGFIALDAVGPYLQALAQIDVFNATPARGTETGTALERAFTHADAFALHMQGRVRVARIAVFASLTVLVLSYAIYSEYAHPLGALLVYFCALGIGAAIWLIGRRENFEQRHLDYRTLAEALRIQLMWISSGLNWSVAEYYLRKHRNELRWIQFALRAYTTDEAVMQTLERRRTARTAHHEAIDEGAIRKWIVDQRDYFRRSAGKRERLLQILNRLSAVVYALGLLAAFLEIAGHLIASLRTYQHELIMLMGVFPGLAGTIGAWIKQVAMSEEAARLAGMDLLFTQSLDAWDDPRNARARALIANDLGKEALHESADWLALRRGRRIEVPLGSG
jgi:hypothetical protein